MTTEPSTPSPDDVFHALSHRVFGGRLVQNNFRGEVAETIVGLALGDGWTHCSRDWTGWDFEQATPTPVRIQVKQSAARQTWHHPESAKPCDGSFNIAPKTGFYRGTTWRALPGRHAEIFVFCWHPVVTPDADHRDPAQWSFFVVPEHLLPAKKQISLSALHAITHPVNFGELRRAVDEVAGDVRHPAVRARDE